MPRSTLTMLASAVNYGVALAGLVLVVHVSSGGVLPAQATFGIVLAAGGLCAMASSFIVDQLPAERINTEAAVRRVEPQPAMALVARPASMSA